MTQAIRRSDLGATVEVVRSYLVAAAEEMRTTLVRTAFNPVIYEVLDFGLSIYDENAELIAEAPGLTRFLGANDYSLVKGIEYVGRDNLGPGDVVLLNYPYWNAAHAYDATLFAPVHMPDGRHVGYVCVRAHWMDLGAKDPGYVLDSTDVHQEGLLFPGTKVFEAGKPVEPILELIRFNSRMPDLVIGDLHAQVSALRTGERRLVEIIDKFGKDTVDHAVATLKDMGEAASRVALARFPLGSWTATDWVDDDGITDSRVRICVTVTHSSEGLTVDFSDSDRMVHGPINLPFGATIAAARVAFKVVTTPFEESNAGHFRPLKVIAEPGTLFHAIYPAATFTQWVGNHAVELVLKALAQAQPKLLSAGSGGDVPGFMNVGRDPGTLRTFAISNNDPVGWGGTATHDGLDASNHPCQTVARNTPVEVLETSSLMTIERLEMRTDSGGPGRYRGGVGIVRDIRFSGRSEFLSVVKKTKTASWPLLNGLVSAPTQVIVNPGTSEERTVGTVRVQVGAGDRVRLVTAGGAGYGDPRDRPPAEVKQDIADGFVSQAAAISDYSLRAEEM